VRGREGCPRGARIDVSDRGRGKIEGARREAGADDEAEDWQGGVRRRLGSDRAALTGGQAPADFIRVIQTVFDLKQDGNLGDAGALISWLCGSGNVAASAKRQAGIKGEISSRDALDYLRGVLEIVKAAGYKGLVIVIDEAETILRMRKDTRHKSLNGIRQIADSAGSYPGLLWLFTGTPDFFDSRQGVGGLPPLHDRIAFKDGGDFTSLRQAQLVLKPFNAERLRGVALRLRELYHAEDPSRLDSRISDNFIQQLEAEVTAGFKGDVGIVPRQFLREFVTQMDKVDEFAAYDPHAEYAFSPPDPTGLRPEEQQVLSGAALAPLEEDDDDDDLIPTETAW